MVVVRHCSLGGVLICHGRRDLHAICAVSDRHVSTSDVQTTRTPVRTTYSRRRQAMACPNLRRSVLRAVADGRWEVFNRSADVVS